MKDGKQVENQIYPPVPEGPVYLLLMRRKGRVVVGASFNLGMPPMPFKGIEFDLAPKVKIGLSASNISAKPFTAQFENFALISNETQMDAMFGDELPTDTSETRSRGVSRLSLRSTVVSPADDCELGGRAARLVDLDLDLSSRTGIRVDTQRDRVPAGRQSGGRIPRARRRRDVVDPELRPVGRIEPNLDGSRGRHVRARPGGKGPCSRPSAVSSSSGKRAGRPWRMPSPSRAGRSAGPGRGTRPRQEPWRRASRK